MASPTPEELQAQINALQQQLNQIIGMADDDFVLPWSGEEFEELLSGAGAASVRYDTTQTLTAAQQTQARSNINAANMDTQNAVLAVDAPYTNVNLTPEELPAYVKALPRLLTKDLWLTLSAGTCTENLYISNFYGPGRLWIQAASGAEVTFTGGCYVTRCNIQIVLSQLKFVGGKGHYNDIICVEVAPLTLIFNCTIDANNTGYSGVDLQSIGNCLISGGTIKNAKNGVELQGSIICELLNVAASGNTVGVKTNGGIVMLSGSTPLLVGGASNQNNGGIVVKANGTLN